MYDFSSLKLLFFLLFFAKNVGFEKILKSFFFFY